MEEGCRPLCETLWHSKLSLPSSTDVECHSVPRVQEINFDAKLEEAHMLIEKVKAALRDIGKGAHRVPDDNKSPPTPKKSKKCIKVCVPKQVEERTVEIETKSRCKKPKECALMLKNLSKKVTTKKSKDFVMKNKKDKLVIAIRLGEDVSSQPNLENIEMLQTKLNTISEGAESNESKSEGFTIPAALMERASSPIDFTALCVCPSAEKTKIDEAFQSVDSTPRQGSSKGSSEKVSRKASEKASKLTIQTMPPVSIQGGLVMQRTLHLCINPTGNAGNAVDNYQNVGYREISTEDKSKKKCSEQCMTPKSNCFVQKYVLSEDNESEVSEELRPETKKKVIIANDLDDEALMLYKSYQIFENKTNMRGSLGSNGQTRPQPPKVNRYRNPVDMGFYKTQSTQCSEASLQDTVKFVETTSVTSDQPAPVVEEPQKEEAANVSGEASEPSERDHSVKSEQTSQVSEEQSSLHASVDNKGDEVSSQKSASAEEVEGTGSFDSSNLTNQEIEKSLLDSAMNDSQEDLLNEMPVREEKVSFSTQEDSETAIKPSKVSDTSSVPSTSSSGSSYNVQGSYTDVTSRPVVQDNDPVESNPVIEKRLSQESSEQVQPSNAFTESEEEVKEEVKEEPVKESEEPATAQETKVDQNVQVFLGSSSTEEQEDDDHTVSKGATVESFIKGLTGRSEENIHNFRTSSLRKVSALSGNKSNKSKSSYDSQKDEPIQEVVIGSHDYTKDNKDTKDAKETKDTKVESDKKKMKEFQNVEFNDRRRNESDKSKIVMRLQQEAGENSNFLQLTSRKEHSFYRRVLGKFTDSTKRNPMQKSGSFPIDESLSEGEVKFKTSLSIGEVEKRKPHHKKIKARKECESIKRYTEEAHRKELEDSTSKIARQREQYNNWITQYMQKHNRIAKNDYSSSGSFSISLKK